MAEVGENRLFAALWDTSISSTPVESERLFLEQVKICLNELEVSQN
jgi:hypothetical protein